MCTYELRLNRWYWYYFMIIIEENSSRKIVYNFVFIRWNKRTDYRFFFLIKRFLSISIHDRSMFIDNIYVTNFIYHRFINRSAYFINSNTFSILYIYTNDLCRSTFPACQWMSYVKITIHLCCYPISIYICVNYILNRVITVYDE